jgi:hypothetical protein
LPNFGSGRISRLGTSRRRGIISPLICFSWRLGRHRKNHFGFYLLDPTAGHYAESPRHAGNSTIVF